MTTVYVDRKGAELFASGQAIMVRVPGQKPESLTLAHIERLIVRGSSTISSGLLAKCWERQISVLFLSGRRSEATAKFEGGFHHDAAIRLAQSSLYLNPVKRLDIAKLILRFKLCAQYVEIKHFVKSYPKGSAGAFNAISALNKAKIKVRNDPPNSLSALRGLEGAAAAAYFQSYITFFPESLGFSRRIRRPPTDPVNAALSLGYTLALSEAARSLNVVGLDPAIGFLHEISYNRSALALDLVEPLRPLVDRFVLNTFRSRKLTARHFKSQSDGSIILGKSGRAHFYSCWEENAPSIRRVATQHSKAAAKYVREISKNDCWIDE